MKADTYRLQVQTEEADKVVRLRLTDSSGVHRGSHQVQLTAEHQLDWEGLLDTRNHVDRYQDTLQDEHGQARSAEQILDGLGVFLGQQVLGPKIMAELCKYQARRTLLVHLPDLEGDVLGAAFARIPWELARPAPGDPSLMERDVVVRAVTESTKAGDPLVRANDGGVVRVLLVFAEAPGSRPLAMRLEREQLRALFERDVLPYHNVEVDILCHGVTRKVLRESISAAGGYDIVHWSGHGHHNVLELRGEDGQATTVTGEQLVALFSEAGGFIPTLFFLSACLSGAFVDTAQWKALRARIRGEPEPAASDKQARSLHEALDTQQAPGYTGTALALLRSGVPQVVAMRYSVADDYARELACSFYKRLLVDRGRHSTESALALARADVRHSTAVSATHKPVDHANSVVFGQSGRPAEPARRRSAQMNTLRPRPQPVLDGGSQELERREMFVGRGQMLTRLNRAWQPGGTTVTVIQGMGGLGKTSLAAEALHLWHPRFDWVLAFQAKPVALPIEEFLRRVDGRLRLESTTYLDRVEHSPLSAVYLEPSPRLQGEARYARMRTNLLQVLRDERVLLVLDNFERNLEPSPREGGYACSDPQWDALLEALARLPPETGSRVLMTSRHRLRGLAGPPTLWLPLGPLPADEAVLFVRNHAGLAALLRDDKDAEGRTLLEQVLRVSHGHPVILEQLGALAGDRPALQSALKRLGRDGMRSLSTLTEALSDTERAYLEDVVEGSVDILLERQSPMARRLLWVVSLAHEPVPSDMLEGVWAGRSVQDDELRQLRVMMAMLDHLPQEVRDQFEALPPELRQQLEAVDAEPAEPAEPVGPLLEALHEAGLLSREAQTGKADDQPASGVTYGCHELVRERVDAWMQAHADERGGRTATQVAVGYGQRYGAAFKQLQSSGRPDARTAAAEAGRRALVYLVRAGEFEALGSFASDLVTSTNDPGLLGHIIAELRAVAEQVPEGKNRWHVRTYLADALTNCGRPDQALPLYEQAVAEAEQAQHWGDVATVTGNWAGALRNVGQLDAAKAMLLRSAEAEGKAGRPAVNIVGSELEALRIDVMQGRAEQAWPDIETRLDQVRGWWQAHEQGATVPEAPDTEFLGRVLVSGLDIAQEAKRALEHWEDIIALLEEIEAVQEARGESEQQRARTRFNQYGPLLRLGRLDEAQRILEHCLAMERRAGDLMGESKVLSALADLWYTRGNPQQAAELERKALAVRNRLPDPGDRAISHNNLSNYLNRLGSLGYAEHRLAAMTYRLVSGEQRNLSTTLRNLAIEKRRALADGRSYTLPRLRTLLAEPAFHALAQFLAAREVDLDELQTTLDQLEVMAEKAAGAPAPSTLGDLPPALRQLLAPLLQVATLGQDIEPLLAELRTKLLEQSPYETQHIDAFLSRIRTLLPGSTTTPT